MVYVQCIGCTVVIYMSFVYTNKLLRYYFAKNNPPLFIYFSSDSLVYIIFNHMPFYSQKASKSLSFSDILLNE